MLQSKSYCSDCQRLVDETRLKNKAKSKAKSDKKYNQTKRNPMHTQFYKSSQWKTLRAVKLSQSDYLCESCREVGILTLAVDVHHENSIDNAWEERLKIENLKCLCVKCHNQVHDRWKKQKNIVPIVQNSSPKKGITLVYEEETGGALESIEPIRDIEHRELKRGKKSLYK